jgi:MscS family membrane protein
MAGSHSRKGGAIWSRLRPLASALGVAWLILAPTFARPGHAESASESPAAEAPEVAGPADDYDRGVPQTSMLGYLLAARAGDYERAGNYLDLRRLPKAVREAQGPQLARQLKVVLDRTLWVDVEALSEDPRGQEDDGLPANRDLVGRIDTQQGKVDILLQRVPREDGVRVWEISSATVERIPQLYKEFGYGRLGEILPAPFIEIHFLEIRLWQWIGLLALVFAAGLAGWLGVGLTIRVLGHFLGRILGSLEEPRLFLARGPLRLLVAVLVFSAGKLSLRLAVPVQENISRLESALLVFAFAWLSLRAVDLTTEIVRRHLIQRAQEQATSLLPPGRKTAKAVVVAIAVIAMLNNLGFNVTALVAGLGVGGIAVALAAQKSLENLLGGINLYVDQPVRVGDFCRFGDKIGTIEDIGMRSTRVRTLDRTVVSIANAEFSNLQIENFAKRDKIWYHPRIGLRYETTPDQIRYILVEVRKMLYAHPRIHPDPTRIRFVDFGSYSLDLDIFAYVRATDYGEFLEVAEDINLRIMDIVERAGSGFAFPSQTTYVESGEGLDTERARAAEAEVQRWRERRELCVPGFPPRAIEELRGTLDYPPKGSATGNV